jgi:hypothetical protein
MFGIRALAMILRNYKRKYDICTIGGIVNRFAPSSENDTKAYIQSVCATCGRRADEPLDIENEVILRLLIKAIIKHENGRQPYTDEQIKAGLKC